MFSLRRTLAAAALSLAFLAPAGFASAADMAVKAVKAPPPDLPFFLVIDNRVTFSYIFSGTDPGMWSVRPDGSINGKTEKQVYSFTHFDAWAYGTNFFTISMYKSGHNDPASPCTNSGFIFATAADCAGATEIYGLFRSTLAGTKSSTYSPRRSLRRRGRIVSMTKRTLTRRRLFASLLYGGRVFAHWFVFVRQPPTFSPNLRAPPPSAASASASDSAFEPNMYIRIDKDGTVTLSVFRSEMGGRRPPSQWSWQKNWKPIGQRCASNIP